MKNLLLSIILIISVNITAQWQTDVRLTNNPAYSSTYYNNAWSIGASGNTVHVVWTDLRNGNNEIYYKRSTDEGTSWGADTRLTIDTAQSWNTSVAVSGSAVHVVWIDNRNGNWEIYYKRSFDSGISWGTDTRLSSDASYSEFPSVAASGSVVHVVWTDNRDGNYEIYYKRSTDGGVIWGAETRLTSNAQFSLTPSVSVSGTSVHVVWRDFRDGNYEIYYKLSTDAGASWGADIRLTNNIFDSGDPSLSASGQLSVAAWMDIREGNWMIFYKRSTDGGASWGVDTRLTFGPSDPASPSVSVSGLAIHIVWQDYRDGNQEIYYKRSVDGGITWSIDTRLTNNPSVSEIPSVTVSGQAVHVIWTDERDGNREIYYKRDPTGNPLGIISISSEIPGGFSLSQNYPNPFNPGTIIRFQINKLSNVKLVVYDIQGRQITELINLKMNAGTYEIDWNASNFPSGVYYYKLSAGEYSETRKMVLVK